MGNGGGFVVDAVLSFEKAKRQARSEAPKVGAAAGDALGDKMEAGAERGAVRAGAAAGAALRKEMVPAARSAGTSAGKGLGETMATEAEKSGAEAGERAGAAVKREAREGARDAGTVAGKELGEAMKPGAAAAGHEAADAMGDALKRDAIEEAREAGEAAADALRRAAGAGAHPHGGATPATPATPAPGTSPEPAPRAKPAPKPTETSAPDDEPAKQAAERSGDEVAERYLAALKRRLDADMGKIHVAAARGLITTDEAELRGRDAAARYNSSVLAGLGKMEAQGKLTRGAAATLGNSLLDVKKVGEDTASSAESFGAKASSALTKIGTMAKLWIAGALASALVLAVRGLGALWSTLDDADQRIRSFARLSSTARLIGVEMSVLTRLSNMARKELKLASTDANDLAVASATMAKGAGKVADAQVLMARALDLGAAKGLTAKEVTEALTQTLRGEDEGINKLGLANPSGIYNDWAKAAGTTAAKMTDAQKAQALMNAIIAAGTRVQGEYGKQIQTDLGRWQSFKTRMGEVRAEIGEKFMPIAAALAEKFEQVLGPAIEFVTGMLDRMRSPLETSIALMKELGRSAVEVLPMELKSQISNTESQEAQLRAEIERRRMRTRSVRHGADDWSVDLIVDERNIYQMRADQRRLEAKAQGGTMTADDSAEYERTKRLVELEEKLNETLNRRGNLQNELRGAERLAAKARSVREKEDELEALRDEMAARGENVALLAREAQLVREIAEEKGAAGMNEVVNPVGAPVNKPDEEDASTKAATRQLAELRRELTLVRQFTNAEGNPFRSMGEIVEPLRAAVQEVKRLDDEITSAEQNIKKGGRADPQLLAQVESLREQRREAYGEALQLNADLAERGDLIPPKMREARDQLREMTGSFQRLGTVGVALFGAVPPLLKATTDEHERLNKEVERYDKAIREAGAAAPAWATQTRDAYKAQAEWIATLTLQLGEAKDALLDLPDVDLALFQGMDPAESQQVIGSLRNVASETTYLRRAEQDAWAARQKYGAGSREARTAEHALASARELSRQALLREIEAVENSTMSDKEKVRWVKFLRAQVDGLGGDVRQAHEGWIKFAEGATKIGGAVRDIASVADALFGLTERQQMAVDGYAEMVEGAAKFAQAYAQGDVFGMISGAAQSIKGMVNFTKGAFGWGTTEAEKARHEVERGLWLDMIGAMRELRKALLNTLSSEEIQADAAKAKAGADILDEAERKGLRGDAGLAYLARQWGLAGKDSSNDEANRALQAMLQQWDEKYGTTLAQFAANNDRAGLEAALRDLPAALREALGKQGTYTDDAAGIMERANDEAQLFGTTLLDKLIAINAAMKAAGKRAGDFQDELDELAGLDLSTEEGRKRRDELVRAMFAAMAAGGAKFGSLSPEQLKELLGEWMQAEGKAGGAVGEESNAARVSVAGTEVQMNDLLLQAASQTEYLRGIFATGGEILAALRGGAAALPLPTAPVLPSPAAFAVPSSVTMTHVITMNWGAPLRVDVSGDAVDPRTAGEVADRLGRGIVRGMNAEVAEQARALGLPVPSVGINYGGRA